MQLAYELGNILDAVLVVPVDRDEASVAPSKPEVYSRPELRALFPRPSLDQKSIHTAMHESDSLNTSVLRISVADDNINI